MSKESNHIIYIFGVLLLVISLGAVCSTDVFGAAVVNKQQELERQKQRRANKLPPPGRLPQQQQLQRQQGRLPSINPQLQQAQEEVIDLVDIWRELDFSSEVWPLIIDRHPKEVTIQEYINLYRERGVNINKPAAHYVSFIDGLLSDRKELLRSPIKDVLRFAAIVEYDFDNGQNRDQMALKLLGETVYRENKKRLGY